MLGVVMTQSERDLKAYNYAIGLSEYAAMDFSSGWDQALESDLLKKEREAMREHLELALSFAPKGPAPEGLDPSFYHTLNYADEVKLQKRIDKAREALANYHAAIANKGE